MHDAEYPSVGPEPIYEPLCKCLSLIASLNSTDNDLIDQDEANQVIPGFPKTRAIRRSKTIDRTQTQKMNQSGARADYKLRADHTHTNLLGMFRW